jgi:uncharacterized protein (DUF488 family)
MQRDDQAEVFTVGHSTHSLDHLVGLLREHGVECVADVRLIPRSRRMPHFADRSLAGELPGRGVRYLPLKALGGRRRARPDSRNGGWRVGGFRGYADYMETDDFARALGTLEETARECRTAVMCAEGLWWRCHRRLIADALLVRGWRVTHIGPDGRTEPHRLTPFAVVEDGRLTYPPPAEQLGLRA